MDDPNYPDLRDHLARIAPEKGRVESLRDHLGGFEVAIEGAEGAEAAAGAEAELADEALRAVEQDDPLTEDQARVLEAIVLPRERPVVDVIEGSFARPDTPFDHYGDPAIRRIIERAIPAVGRVELPGHPSLPFGGTAFVVGDGLMMTNRHVAELFASGLGREALAFISGREAGVDFLRERDRPASLFFEVDRVLMVHPYWDMALLAVKGLPADQSTLTLATAATGDLLGREVAVVGYPALDPRNDAQIQNTVFRSLFNVKRLQPGKIGEPAGVRSFGKKVTALTHDCSTLGGNSGSAVVDVQDGTVLALHFAGSYLVANYGVPAHALAGDRRVVDAGVQFDHVVHPPATVEWEDFWTTADPAVRPRPGEQPTGVDAPLSSPDGDVAAATSAPAAQHRIVIDVPLEITVRVAAAATGPAAVTADTTTGIEAAVEPFHDEDLHHRDGYDDMFLGIPLPMPELHPGVPVSQLDDGSTEVRYEHFSAVMNSRRRLAHFLAANVDGRPAKTQPEPGRDYSRVGLSGLGPNDRERWFTDPRIPADHQLPDRFFNRDRGSFDKGHIVRRTYVAWGDTYDQVRRANGDTYHVTNCSPQIAAFNQSMKHGLWGELENLIQDQAKADTYTVFAGPVFRDDDPDFEGRDDRGRTIVKIPRSFWKVIVARTPSGLQTFAFELAQDLSEVDFTELAFEGQWRERMVGVRDLEAKIGTLRFPDILADTDQSATDAGATVRELARL